MVSSELVWPAVWIPLKTVKQTSWAETWLDPEKKKRKGLNLHQGRFKQLASNYDGIRGGGLALYVNNRWCSSSHVKVRTAVRNKHTELLAIGLRPYYLPWEFSLVIIIIVYSPGQGWSQPCPPPALLQTYHPEATWSHKNCYKMDKEDRRDSAGLLWGNGLGCSL